MRSILIPEAFLYIIMILLGICVCVMVMMDRDNDRLTKALAESLQEPTAKVAAEMGFETDVNVTSTYDFDIWKMNHKDARILRSVPVPTKQAYVVFWLPAKED